MKNSPTPPGVPPAPSKPRSDLPPKLAPVSPIVGRLYTGGWSMALVRKSRLSTTDTLPELERWVVVVDVVVPVAIMGQVLLDFAKRELQVVALGEHGKGGVVQARAAVPIEHESAPGQVDTRLDQAEELGARDVAGTGGRPGREQGRAV